MGQILRALRVERLILDLIEFGIRTSDILALSDTFQVAAWGEVIYKDFQAGNEVFKSLFLEFFF